MNDSFGSAKDAKSKVIWALLSFVIAGLSIFAVTRAVDGFSFDVFRELLRGAHPLWLGAAVLAMLGFVFFEGMAVRTLVMSFGQKLSVRDSFVVSAADIYFSAITPSATGGQPASAFFMIKYNVPTSCATISLVFNLALYTAAILIIGVVSLIAAPSIYMLFRPLSRVIIVIGALILIAMGVLFVLLTVKRSFVETFGRIIIGIGCRFRILKDRMAWNKKLENWINQYMHYASSIGGHRAAIAKALVFNILQRLCQLSVTMFVYIGVNIGKGILPAAKVIYNGARLLGAQSLISIGSTFVPIPGGMGFTDLMMLDGFANLMPEAEAAGLELLSRSISFYACVIICFIVVVAAFFARRKKDA